MNEWIYQFWKKGECYVYLTKAQATSTESPSSKKLLIYIFWETLSSFIMFRYTHQGIPATAIENSKLFIKTGWKFINEYVIFH